MRLKYDDGSLKKIKDLVSKHKTNDEICAEFWSSQYFIYN